jgi:hypothetical protein
LRNSGESVLAPRTSAYPPLGLRSPARILKVVVFPAPLGPTSPTTSPWAACRETPRNASNLPNLFWS